MMKFTKRLTLLLYHDGEISPYNSFLTDNFGKIIIVNNFDDAIKAYEEHEIDILILELNSHYEEKFSYLKYAREQNLLNLIIILSKDESFDTLTRAIKIGIDGYYKSNLDQKSLMSNIYNLENKYLLSIKYKDDIENLNLLKQYQNITDKTSLISKTDTKGTITYVNENFCKLSGYTEDELIGKNHNIVRSLDNPIELYEDMWHKIKKKKQQWTGILKNISKNGNLFYVKTTITPLLDQDGNIIEYISLRQNISSIVADKKYFLDKISSNIMSILILLQIEDFNMLEKSHNAYIIDQIEKCFGYSLLNYLPKSYVFDYVYNLDNGTYALLTNFDNFASANIRLDTYLKEFVNNVKKSRLDIDGTEYDISVMFSYSFGKHMLYEDAKSGLEMTKKRNIEICPANDFSIKDQIEAKKNLKVIKMVKKALEEFKILSYFQPIINNKTQEVEKYESLVRLITEDGKVVSPLEFLDATKRSSYYNKITARVLENSFEILKSIRTELSINLSMIDIENNGTREHIYALLEDNKKDSNRLIFELLEDERVKDFTNVKIFIKKVKSMGVSIAIDDFGTGYSNFERLLKFEPDLLKIDGSLIKNIITDKYSQNIVETIVGFAKRQNIKTIAEYVETKEIFDYLNNLGIDYSQGYFFGKPEYLVF